MSRLSVRLRKLEKAQSELGVAIVTQSVVIAKLISRIRALEKRNKSLYEPPVRLGGTGTEAVLSSADIKELGE